MKKNQIVYSTHEVEIFLRQIKASFSKLISDKLEKKYTTHLDNGVGMNLKVWLNHKKGY